MGSFPAVWSQAASVLRELSFNCKRKLGGFTPVDLFPVVVSELNPWVGVTENSWLSFIYLFSFPLQLQGVQKCPGWVVQSISEEQFWRRTTAKQVTCRNYSTQSKGTVIVVNNTKLGWGRTLKTCLLGMLGSLLSGGIWHVPCNQHILAVSELPFHVRDCAGSITWSLDCVHGRDCWACLPFLWWWMELLPWSPGRFSSGRWRMTTLESSTPLQL